MLWPISQEIKKSILVCAQWKQLWKYKIWWNCFPYWRPALFFMLCWQEQDEKEIQFPSSVQSLASLTINESACFTGVFLLCGNSAHRNRTGNHQIASQPADGNGCVSSPPLALANNVEVKTPTSWSISVCFIHLLKISSLKSLWPDLRGRCQSTALWRVSLPEGEDRGQFSFLIFLQMGMLNVAPMMFHHYSWDFGSGHINQANLVASFPIQQNSFTGGEGINRQGCAAGGVGMSPAWCIGDRSVQWFPAVWGGHIALASAQAQQKNPEACNRQRKQCPSVLSPSKILLT